MKTATVTNQPKDRLVVRIDAALKQQALAASQLESTDMTSLVIRGLIREISEIQQRHNAIPMGKEDFQSFLALVEEVRPLSPTLERAAERRRQKGFNFELRNTGQEAQPQDL